ncbi:MAG: cell wall hydrolase [Lachnospiraceae bacterium]|nr:cell wall hydrolase [Lachnospiraceae bacterium]
MRAWVWIGIGMGLCSLNQPVQLLHNWPEAGSAMAGVSVVCQEDWLDALEEYYGKDETEEVGRGDRFSSARIPESEPAPERMADTELPPKRENSGAAEETDSAETASAAEETSPEPEPEAEAEVAAAPSNRWGIQLSKEEIDLLACIVWVESRGEPDDGQKAVVEVVFNRMAHGAFPGTLYEVVSQRAGGYLQFTSWNYVGSAAPTEKEYRNIQAVLNGQTAFTNNNTIYFSTSPQTRNITCVIGGHYFCE